MPSSRTHPENLAYSHHLSVTMKPPSSPSDELDSISVLEIDKQVLRYLSLPADYKPKPSAAPLEFLRQHLSNLPSSLLQHHFAPLLTPLTRTTLPAIRNRRLAYHSSAPAVFTFPVARNQWVQIWDEIAPGSVLNENWREQASRGGQDEESWAEGSFLRDREVAGNRRRLGKLLGGYEEERIGDEERQKRSKRLRERHARRSEELHAQEAEEKESDEEESSDEDSKTIDDQHLKAVFERVLKERFIDGRLNVRISTLINYQLLSIPLQNVDYDSVDWDDQWDVHSRDEEDKWFDEDDDE
jgi:hypothetical protein